MLSKHKACICLEDRNQLLLAAEKLSNDLKVLESQILRFILNANYFYYIVNFSFVLEFEIFEDVL
jgi:hypothetical protein